MGAAPISEPASEPAGPARGIQERIADNVTSLCGDMRFVYLHTLLFGTWIATRGFGSDKFPFNFLTMAVSLEAIFLSTFILISQNRQQAVAEAQNKIVQDALLKMLQDVIDDEKLDQSNEELIQTLVTRLDVEHVRPMQEKIDAVLVAVSQSRQAGSGDVGGP